MLKIDSQVVNGVTLLTLEGRLIFGQESNALNQQIGQLREANVQQVLLDLSGVSFIDSSGIGELIAAFTALRKAGGTLKLCSPTQQVSEVFKIVSLPKVIEICSTQQEALASFE